MSKGDYKRGNWQAFIGTKELGQGVIETVFYVGNQLIAKYRRNGVKMEVFVDNPVNINVRWMSSMRRQAKQVLIPVLMTLSLSLGACSKPPEHVPADLPAYFSCPVCETPVRTAFAYLTPWCEIEGDCPKHGTQKIDLANWKEPTQ